MDIASENRPGRGFAGGERNTNSDIIAETYEAAGAYVMGRRMADGGEIPWGETPPFRAPVFVVTHRPRPPLQRLGGTTFTYVTEGVASAIAQARAAAGGKNVAVAGGGTLLREVIKLGLLDELELHVAPLILGPGTASESAIALDLLAASAPGLDVISYHHYGTVSQRCGGDS